MAEFDLDGGMPGVKVFGNPAGRPVVFGHGSSAETVWRQIVPAFLDDHRVVLVDHSALAPDAVGDKYELLAAGVTDLVRVVTELELDDPVFVGHSASAVVGALTSVQQPFLFSSLVLVSPSFRHLGRAFNEYDGDEPDISTMFGALSNETLGTLRAMAAEIQAGASGEESAFAAPRGRRAAAPSASYHYFPLPTLILQSAFEMLEADGVAGYLRSHIPECEFVVMTASHADGAAVPSEVGTAIRSFLVRSAPRRANRVAPRA
ncbi:alpha/beta fold hydrolase [Desertivibrio insolitus]|uniref:alpha/beta fold hydrolase n=1 Tax=Herbiconiux sp. SYSU D00978 TaxID=2812562 RepID=UPI001A9648CB|nr:alpha/beta hydrolase [Herbiconiux sp. SYSU D00978]